MVHFLRSGAGCFVGAYLRHHHLHSLPPLQLAKNTGLQVLARSSLLCFYLDSKPNSGEGCGKQTAEMPGPQGTCRGWGREQAGKTRNITFLQTAGKARSAVSQNRLEHGLPGRQVCWGSQSQLFENRIIKEGWQQE